MCGIIGYVGKRQASPVLLDGLRRLEYRGYDSAGVAVLDGGRLDARKKRGKIDQGLATLIRKQAVPGHLGIGHTRWATHGEPSDENSHPHLDQSTEIAVVHNGVIENFDQLKQELIGEGHQFQSETDTEVLAHLVGKHYQPFKKDTPENGQTHPLTKAVVSALKEVVGTYGIAVVCADYPGIIVGARRGSPLIVGVGDNENFLASDAAAIVSHTRQVVYLNDLDVVTVSAGDFKVERLDSAAAEFQISELEFEEEAVDKGGYDHFMLKEIFEQPRAVQNAMRGRINFEEATAKLGGLNLAPAELRAVDRIVIPSCGTSWHAALVGEYLFEDLAHIPVEVEYASEFRYRNAPIEKNTLTLVISQSGETADTLAGLRESRRRGHKVLGLVNAVGSTIARESDGGVYLHAGPEIGVASTKAFTSQVTVLILMAVLMGRIRMMSARQGTEILKALEKIPQQMETVLALDAEVKRIALKYAEAEDFFFLGRQYSYPVAMEGALKLKEISYIHAEGYPAAEMKHGPIAMIDKRTPTVFLAPSDTLYEKTVSNLEEIKARKGPVIALVTEGNERIAGKVDDLISLPPVMEQLWPLLAAIPLQLLSYHIAVARGCDVDKPRNLAKSVTVE
jgi:glucosamine--fructose-6-phosphate aminotransferase (isomerizing)